MADRLDRRTFLAALALAAAACSASPRAIAPRAGYAEIAARLERAIEYELSDKALPALSIALVDGDEIAWAHGFGEARPGVPASADTVYRVGSVSKLFTCRFHVYVYEWWHFDFADWGRYPILNLEFDALSRER